MGRLFYLVRPGRTHPLGSESLLCAIIFGYGCFMLLRITFLNDIMHQCMAIVICSAILLTIPLISTAQISAPVFSHPAGTFTDTLDLEFSVSDGATVYYTTNGELPDQNTYEYVDGEPILVHGSIIIRARAYAEDEPPSEIVSKVYSQVHPEMRDFDSDLPLVIVHQFDEKMIDQCDNPYSPTICDRSTAYYSAIDKDEDGRARLLSDNLHLQSRMETNFRGTSSLRFPKKQFAVRLVDDYDENRNEPVLGMPSENNWIMSAPYDDKTLIRNALAYQISRDMGRYAPRTRFVELFLHDGHGPLTMDHYHGVYMLTERIKWDNNRVNIRKLEPEHNFEPEITGGYIINHEFGRESHIISNHRKTSFALVRPQHDDITPQQREWIEGYLGDLEEALFGPESSDPDAGFAAYLDAGSFIDHHLITELFKEIDGYRLSTYLHKDRGGKLVMGPVWDFNISLGNVNYFPNSEFITDYEPWKPEGWYYELISHKQYLNGWYTRLFQDPEFKSRYRNRWWELRQSVFSTEHITVMIRNYADKLDEAQQRNFERWPILGVYVWPNKFIGDTYEEEIEFIIDWIKLRLDWIDAQMGKLPDQPVSHLRYYWYFDDELANDTPFESLDAGLSLVHNARIRFHSALDGYPFDEAHPYWRKASMERRNRPTDINYRREGYYGRYYDADRMRALQVRQPFTGDGGENMLLFDLPTTGMENVVFRFAAMDEGAADALLIDYSVAEGDPVWTTAQLSDSRYPLTDKYKLFTVEFSEIPESDNNPDFRIRIRFDSDDLVVDYGNRVTFNNFSLAANGDSLATSATDDYDHIRKPAVVRLDQNFPNPFNPVTSIYYAITKESDVRLTVYNALGQVVRVLTDSRKEPGEYSSTFDASGLASGMYIYELRAGDQKISRNMLFVK